MWFQSIYILKIDQLNLFATKIYSLNILNCSKILNNSAWKGRFVNEIMQLSVNICILLLIQDNNKTRKNVYLNLGNRFYILIINEKVLVLCFRIVLLKKTWWKNPYFQYWFLQVSAS